jgi:hypothetical protein
MSKQTQIKSVWTDDDQLENGPKRSRHPNANESKKVEETGMKSEERTIEGQSKEERDMTVY